MSQEVRTYTFTVVLEPADGMWHAYCPTLLGYGAATWAATREEALEHIREVVAMVVARMAEDGVPVPTVPADQEDREQGSVEGERVIVTVSVPATDAPPGPGETAARPER